MKAFTIVAVSRGLLITIILDRLRMLSALKFDFRLKFEMRIISFLA